MLQLQQDSSSSSNNLSYSNNTRTLQKLQQMQTLSSNMTLASRNSSVYFYTEDFQNEIDLTKDSFTQALMIVQDLPLEIVISIYEKAFTLHPEMDMHKLISMMGLDSVTDYIIGWWLKHGYSVSLDQHNVHLFMLDHRSYDFSYGSSYICKLFEFLQKNKTQLGGLELFRVLPKHEEYFYFDLMKSDQFNYELFSSESSKFTNNVAKEHEKVFVMKNKPDTELNKDSIIDCFMVPDKLNHLSLRDRGHKQFR
ncbi:unnamed protein product [Ambrosiozyma monospora]|uniref:Unnamed protein product n=1 Tax=Ambrosiozyma monospora TaxID=43982 RepID=A0ACB5UA08_AMBMO|nr:unnamed protein product [Ambrosiozyma monospora]